MATYRIYKKKTGLYALAAELRIGDVVVKQATMPVLSKGDVVAAAETLAEQMGTARKQHRAVRDGTGIEGVTD